MRIMHACAWLALVLFAGCVLPGCDVSFSVNKQNETDMGSHHVVIRPGATVTSSTSLTGGDESTYKYTCGKVHVTIRNEELIVNESSYGELEPNDDILIDNGKVYVEGKERSGRPLTGEEKLQKAAVKETSEELAGHTVTVRPGANITTSTDLFGKHTLRVGKTKIVIKDDELSVNEKNYGRLREGDTILVENERVFVSGSERSARPTLSEDRQ